MSLPHRTPASIWFEVYVDGGWPVDAVLGEQTRGRGIRYDVSGATKTRSITPNWPEVRSNQPVRCLHMTKPDITGIAPFFIVKNVPAALRFIATVSGSTSRFRGPTLTTSSSALSSGVPR